MRRKKFTVTKEDFGEYYEPEFDDKYIGEYMVQAWTFGQREEIAQDTSEQQTNAETGKMSIKIRTKDFRFKQMLACLKKAPFKITEAGIYELPTFIADMISDAISDVNDVISKKEEKKSDVT